MVINMRSAAGMAAIWVIAVAGVSATAWFAIDRAGRDITSASGSTLPLPPLTTPTRASQPIPTVGVPGPSATPAATATPQVSADATPSTSTTPAWTPAPSVTAAPPATRRPRAPGPAPAPAPAPAPVTRYRTVSATGGLVTVRCTGATIRLQNAQPENGWRVHVDTASAGRIVVSFRTGEEEDTRRTQVTAACANGTPAFSVTNG